MVVSSSEPPNPSPPPPQLGASVPGAETRPDPVPVPPDVARLLDRMAFSPDDVLNIDRSDMAKICDLFEQDPLAKISLKVHLISFYKAIQHLKQLESRTTAVIETAPPVATPVISNPRPEQPPSVSSDRSVFGSVVFPPRPENSRDTNRWQPVLGRLYKGSSDPVPISSLCQKLISVGIRESLSNVEFYRFVLANFDIDIHVEIVNYLEKQNCVEDTNAAARLSHLYNFLKSRFQITDSPVILQSRLEKLKQGNRAVSEFADDFSRKLEDLRMAQSEHPLTNSYILCTFKSCLLDKYRKFADELVTAEKFEDLVHSLMVWEMNYEVRVGSPPYSPGKPSSKLQINLSKPSPPSKPRCPFCKRGFHDERKCWQLHPELRPPRCDSCNRFHFGTCTSTSTENENQFYISNGEVQKVTIASLKKVPDLQNSKPWVVRLPYYNLDVVIDTGADCSMVSPEQAASILNQHSNVSLTKLNVPVPVEFGDKKTILCSQSVTLPDTLNDAPVTFLIVPNLSVSIVFGMSQIEQFSLLRPSWLMTALLPVASATADNDGD